MINLRTDAMHFVRCLEPEDVEGLKPHFCLLAVKWAQLYRSLNLSSFLVSSAEMTAGIYVPFMATPDQQEPTEHLIIPAPFENDRIDFARMVNADAPGSEIT